MRSTPAKKCLGIESVQFIVEDELKVNWSLLMKINISEKKKKTDKRFLVKLICAGNFPLILKFFLSSFIH